MRLFAALVLVGVVACSNGAGTGAADGGSAVADALSGDTGTKVLGLYSSGTRLRMRVGTTADGAKSFEGWRDTARNEDCVFQLAADGQRRCLPFASPAAGGYFGDAACTVPLAAWIPCGRALPATAIQQDAAQCPALWHVYQLGARFTGAAYQRAGTSCLGTGAQGAELYGVGAEIPAGEFVAMTVAVE